MIPTDELVRRVRRLVNEADEDSAVSQLEIERTSFDSNIVELLPRAVAFVQKNKKSDGRVNVKSLSPSSITIEPNGDGSGSIVLPDDFVSLVLLQLKGWKRPCTVISAYGSAIGARQYSEFTMAGQCRPVCVEDSGNDGRRMVRAVPLLDGKPEHFIYEAAFDASAGLGMCDTAMADAVAYECAALLYTVFERYDAANSFHSLALAACGGRVTDK